MNSRTEELLNFLFWTFDKLSRPTLRNLTGSYESWAWGDGLERRMAALSARNLVERHPGGHRDRLYCLTEKGRIEVIGGRDPQARWARKWDGRWRLVLFDVPVARNSHRKRLRRYLRAKGFGCLQNSVWISPDSIEEQRAILSDGEINVQSLLFLEARPGAGESDSEIVAGAWDFERINGNYEQYLRILGERPLGRLDQESTAKSLRKWATAEREAWLSVIAEDPLLPERILPPGYLGRRAWKLRLEVLREAGQQLRSYHP